MASVQLQKNTEKSLSQGYYGGNKYQNGCEISYTERERHSQIRCPPTTYGNSQSHDIGHKPYNGGGGGHGNGYGSSHMSNGFGQAQAVYGSNHHTSHGSGHHGNGYGGHSGHHGQGAFGSNHHTSPGKHHGSGNGFWGCDGHGTNGLGNFTNHGMQHSPPHHGGGHLLGHMMKPQDHGHHGGGQMGYGMMQTSETSEYSQVYYSNESRYNGGGRGHRNGRAGHAAGKVKGLLGKIKTSISGNESCSDSDSDDGGYRRKTIISLSSLNR